MNLRSMQIIELAKEDIPASVKERYCYGCPLFARIDSPLVYEQYETLMLDFLQHPYAHAIRARKNRGWERFLKSAIDSQDHIDSIRVLAQLDPLRTDHLSFEFRKVYTRNKKKPEPVFMHFGEESGILRVVKAFIPPSLEHLFHIEKDTYFYTEIKAFSPKIGRRSLFEAERFSMALRG